jgi:hypothetical protein
MFDSHKPAELVQDPSTGMYEIQQGNLTHGEFTPDEKDLAVECVADMNRDTINTLSGHKKRTALLSAGASALVVAGVFEGVMLMNNQGSDEGSGATQPVPTETRYATATATTVVTETPSPEVRIKRVKVTVTAKPHRRVENASHTQAPRTEEPAYVPPAQTYTPPASGNASTTKPRHAPHFTVRHLNERHK